MKRLIGLILSLYSLGSLAHPILITGKPTPLVTHVGYFTLPDNYTQKGRYHFIELGGVKWVCYILERPQLNELPTVTVIIEENKLRVPWTCYRYDLPFRT